MNQDRASIITNSQLKKGYKQTEVGIIPEDWEISKLGNHASFKTGPFGSLLHKHDYVDGGIPVINPMQINNGKIEPTHSMSITENAAKNLSNFHLCAGNIVIGRRGEMGRCAYVNAAQEGWLCGSGSMIIRVDPDIDAQFIQRVLSSPSSVNAIANASVGSTMINLNQSALSNLALALPPTKAEQEAIASTLSDIDALIESLDRLLTKKRQIKQGAMQELLTGKRRLKGFGSKNLNYRQSSMGLIPDDWEQIEIGSSIDMLTGFPFPSSGYSSSGIRLLRGSNVKRGVTDWAEEETKYWASINHDIKQYLLKDKDIVIAMDGSLVGRSFAILSESDLPAILLQRVARIRSNILDQKFLKEWICSRYFTEHCDAVKTVTAIPHISPDNIKSFSILKPPTIDEQIEIANILSDMDAEIDSIESKLAKTRQLKQGMMHELLTGRIRLVENRKSVGAGLCY